MNIFKRFLNILKQEACPVLRKIFTGDFIPSNAYNHQFSLLHQNIAALSKMDSSTAAIKKKDMNLFVKRKKLGDEG